MKRIGAVALAVFLIAGCGGSKSAVTMADLERSNDDLTHRVKALEDQLLEAQKKQIQQDQAIQAMAQRIRDMENVVNKMQVGPVR